MQKRMLNSRSITSINSYGEEELEDWKKKSVDYTSMDFFGNELNEDESNVDINEPIQHVRVPLSSNRMLKTPPSRISIPHKATMHQATYSSRSKSLHTITHQRK